jgi:hypothetical protein
MSEQVRLPHELLPREEQYRSRGVGSFGAVCVSLVLAGALFLGIWLLARVWTAGTYQPGVAELIICVIVGATVVVLWRERRTQAFMREGFDIAAQLEAGELAAAEQRLEAMCRTLSRSSPYHPLIVFNRGIAFLRAGRPDRAIALFAAVLESGRFENPKTSFHAFYPALLSAIAIACAIKGDVAEAERWQGLAHDQAGSARAGALVLMETYIGLRCGRYAVVVKDAEANWAKAEACLLGTQMQALRVLCAFGLANINQESVHDERIRQFLAGARPCRPGQFDYLAIHWPEFRAFLVEHGFATDAKRQP